jgi:hypothetical protein
MDGLIELSDYIGIDDEYDPSLKAITELGLSILMRLRTQNHPSLDRFHNLHQLRVASRKCPFAALALGCLFEASSVRRLKPKHMVVSCEAYGNAVRLAAGRIKLPRRQRSKRYDLCLRQILLEALRRMLIIALENNDLDSAAYFQTLIDKYRPDYPFDQ